MQVRRLQAKDVSLVATIDRSEHVDVQYRVIDGELQPIPAAITEVPAWDPTGSGPHSVTAEIAFCESVVARGGILLGAFDGERTVGLAIVHPAFEPLLAWLAFLHVSRPYRRRGAAQALWNVAADIAGGGRRRVDLRLGDTDRIRGRLLSPTGLSPGPSAIRPASANLNWSFICAPAACVRCLFSNNPGKRMS